MTDSINRLRQIAASRFCGPIEDSAVTAPDFAGAEWLHSWEWYIDHDIRAIWSQLDPESRWVACIGAIEAWRRENEAAF